MTKNKYLVTQCKMLFIAKYSQLTLNEVKLLSDNAIIRAITCKAINKVRDKKTGLIINAYSMVENIPKMERFEQVNNDTMKQLLEYYKHENKFIDWSKQNKVVFSKKQNKDIILDELKKQTFLNSINANLKNACYLYIYQLMNRVDKYNKIKKNLSKYDSSKNIKHKKILKYYEKLASSKNFMDFIKDITYISNTKGNKEYKINTLMFKLSFVFSQLMYNAYNERNVSNYKIKKYNLEFTSIDDINNNINEIASSNNGYDNIEVLQTLKKSLNDTEYSIFKDIDKGATYSQIVTKYGVSMSTVKKIKDRVYSLLTPNVYKKTKGIENKEYKSIMQNIENKKLEVLQRELSVNEYNICKDVFKGMSNIDITNKYKIELIALNSIKSKINNILNPNTNCMLLPKNHNSHILNIKADFIGNSKNSSKIKNLCIGGNINYYNKLNTYSSNNSTVLENNITDYYKFEAMLIANRLYYDFKEYNEFLEGKRDKYTIRIKSKEFKQYEGAK